MLLLCYLGGTCRPSSSTAILGASIPLSAVRPELVWRCDSSGVVRVSSFSTNGALVLANAQDVDFASLYKQILKYGASLAVH